MHCERVEQGEYTRLWRTLAWAGRASPRHKTKHRTIQVWKLAPMFPLLEVVGMRGGLVRDDRQLQAAMRTGERGGRATHRLPPAFHAGLNEWDILPSMRPSPPPRGAPSEKRKPKPAHQEITPCRGHLALLAMLEICDLEVTTSARFANGRLMDLRRAGDWREMEEPRRVLPPPGEA